MSNTTEIKYLSCGLFEVKFKSGKHKVLDQNDMFEAGFDDFAIKYAKCCPNMFVTISQM